MLSTTTITGRVAAEPELREVQADGTPVAHIRLAVEDFRLGKDTVRWIEVAQFGDAAHRMAKHVRKGQHLTVEGLLDADVFEGSDGQPRIGWKLRRAVIEFGPHARRNSDNHGEEDAA